MKRDGRAGQEEAHVRVLEAVAAARAAEELLGEADVAAHGADRGCGGGAGHGGQSRGLEEARDGRSERERRQERGVVRMWLNLNEKGRSDVVERQEEGGGGRGVQWC